MSLERQQDNRSTLILVDGSWTRFNNSFSESPLKQPGGQCPKDHSDSENAEKKAGQVTKSDEPTEKADSATTAESQDNEIGRGCAAATVVLNRA
jgi:hypothetical protein